VLDTYLKCNQCGLRVAARTESMIITSAPCLICVEGKMIQYFYAGNLESFASPPSEELPSVAGNLRAAAKTFEERNRVYGNAFERFGGTMLTLFPDGLTLSTEADWNRMGLYFHLIGKMVRYAANFDEGGHKDSAHDAIAYAAMLELLTKENN
jgi:hypothetical protein